MFCTTSNCKFLGRSGNVGVRSKVIVDSARQNIDDILVAQRREVQQIVVETKFVWLEEKMIGKIGGKNQTLQSSVEERTIVIDEKVKETLRYLNLKVSKEPRYQAEYHVNMNRSHVPLTRNIIA